MLQDDPLAGASLGERQQFFLARTLIDHPKVLILDEALSHLDDESARAIVTQLRAEGRAILLVSHDPRWRTECGVRHWHVVADDAGQRTLLTD